MKYWRIRNTSKALAKKVGHEQGQPRPDPAELQEDRVGRDDRDRRRQEDRRDQQREQQARGPGNRKRANPYATRVHESSVPIVEMMAIATVLNSSRG